MDTEEMRPFSIKTQEEHSKEALMHLRNFVLAIGKSENTSRNSLLHT